tara:strand:- start:980 stop:1309 length:330 start_codon:yes stop_codon:yes gene_type:complete
MKKHLITLSARAITKLKDVLQKENKSTITFSLRSGGCNGFEYKFGTTNDEINDKYDLHIQDDLNVHICTKSTMYVLGTHIDWKEDIMGQGFIFENPNANSTCGCGTSFS